MRQHTFGTLPFVQPTTQRFAKAKESNFAHSKEKSFY